jgi:hypothetical protein
LGATRRYHHLFFKGSIIVVIKLIELDTLAYRVKDYYGNAIFLERLHHNLNGPRRRQHAYISGKGNVRRQLIPPLCIYYFISRRHIPNFTASAWISSNAVSICFLTNCGGTTWISVTPRVFCAVKPVVAVRA